MSTESTARGLRCPKCSFDTYFQVTTICTVAISVHGVEDLEEVILTPDSSVRCPECSYEAPATAFGVRR